MRAIPLAIPLAWTNHGLFDLQSDRFYLEIGSDCLRSRRFFR